MLTVGNGEIVRLSASPGRTAKSAQRAEKEPDRRLKQNVIAEPGGLKPFGIETSASGLAGEVGSV